MHQSGGLVDVAKLASASGLSRPTVASHMEALSIAHAIYPVRPFHGGGRREIVRQPKLYAFDTGFVAFARGWTAIRDDDRGQLWEHLVLDSLRAAGRWADILFWRDKSGCEVDFVLPGPAGRVDAIECKVSPSRFDPAALSKFREAYPEGRNWLVCPVEDRPWTRRWGDLEVTVASTAHVLQGLPA